jgi:DNA-binding NarL/FixJ family response regulator
MMLKHRILTEHNFLVPTWQKGLSDAIISVPDGAPPVLISPDLQSNGAVTVVWVLSSLPHWEQWVRHYSETCHVIVMSKLTSLPEMQKALEAGARGYIEVLANPVQLQQAANTVSQGALWVAAPMLSRLIGIISTALPQPQPQAPMFERLSKREREVAEAVVTGISNKEVASQLNITVRTVKEHLTSVFQKLDINDRLQLILMAREKPLQ